MDLLRRKALFPLFLILYLVSYYCLPPMSAAFTNKSILLLISHPDDEAMFFAPTLLTLTKPKFGNNVKVLCLSSGNADGIGEIRKKELMDSCRCLGVLGQVEGKNGEEDAQKGEVKEVEIIEREELQDSMEEWWDPHVIADILEKEESPIDIIITFDRHGISSHPNHISARKGARQYLLRQGMEEDENKTRPVLFTLSTVPLLRKYISYLDLIFTTPRQLISPTTGEERGHGWPRRLVILSNLAEFARARRAMTDAHKSQMRWFRYGWIWASRYMVINELVRDDVVPSGAAGDIDTEDGYIEL